MVWATTIRIVASKPRKCERSALSAEREELIPHHHQSLSSRVCRRGCWSPGSLLILLLAVAVFAWGTSYKLSLYKASPPGNVAPAKLCTLASNLAKNQLDRTVDAQNAFHVLLPNRFPAAEELYFLPYRRFAREGASRAFSPLEAAPILHLRPPPGPVARIV